MVYLARAVYYMLPNLAPFDLKAAVVHAQHVPGGLMVLNTVYALLYITALMVAATLIFLRRDFK